MVNWSAHAQSTQPQVFGVKLRNVSGRGYWGVDAFMTTPQNLSVASNNFINAPVGLSNLQLKPDLIYIESGPNKDCTAASDCKLRPYYTYKYAGGMTMGAVDPGILLSPGSNYQYKSNYVYNSNGLWQSSFCYSCSTGTVCKNLSSQPVNLKVNDLPYVSAGGESSNFGVTWGNVTASFAQYRPYNYTGQALYSWCYDNPPINSVGTKGTLSVCNTNNFSWTATYTP